MIPLYTGSWLATGSPRLKRKSTSLFLDTLPVHSSPESTGAA
ncbi:hypothetical protein LMG28727_07133 [Paraburkholderia kirstenboschensis]|nr:hypothetical protein LMG28727_07133 [Paraburkholderia kirstenboschensis]